MDRWRHKGLGRVAGRFVAAAMVASLAACASSSVPAVSPVEGVGVTPYGQFLAGRAALNDGRNVEASRYYGAVGRLDPEAAAISDERAFVATLLAGDVTSAAKLAPVSEGVSPSNMALGRIVRAVEGMATGRARSVRDLLAPDTVVFPHRSAAALLAPWAAAMSGDLEGQAVRPQSPGDRIVDVFPADQQPQIITQLSSALEGIVCQRLIPRADGQGRVLASEVLRPSHAIRNCIRERKLEQIVGLMEIGNREGNRTIDQSIAALFEANIITREEAVFNSRERKAFEAPPKEPRKPKSIWT